MSKSPRRSTRIALIASLALTLVSCGGSERETIHSHLEGTVVVRSSGADSVGSFAGFEILITSGSGIRVDTLGFARTDSSGAFSLDTSVDERGVYPLVVSRNGRIVRTGEIAIADGDSGTVSVRLPATRRPLLIRSSENAAWMAYRNSRAGHSQGILQLVQSGRATTDAMRDQIMQTASIMWSLTENFPGTIGAELAAGESILMIEGWADSLVIERSRQIPATHMSFVNVGRAARRADARLHGLESSLAMIDSLRQLVDDGEQRGALAAEYVIALMDSSENDRAGAAARRMLRDYRDTQWASWAGSAIYELENLLPGMRPPNFTALTADGFEIELDRITSPLILIEFFEPTNDIYQRELPMRDSLVATVPDGQLSIVSVSIETDPDINDAFLTDRQYKGVFVVEPDGYDGVIAAAYNVKSLPKRFLIKDGEIVAKYSGGAIGTIWDDVFALLNAAPS